MFDPSKISQSPTFRASTGRASPEPLSRPVLFRSAPQTRRDELQLIPSGPQRSGKRGERTAGVRHNSESIHMQLITFAQRQKLLENGRAQLAAIDRQDRTGDVA